MKLRKRLACMIILVLGFLCMPQMAKAAEQSVDYEKQYVVLSLEGHTLGQGFYLLPEKMSYSEIAAEWKKQNVELDLSNLTVAQATYAFFSRAGLKTTPELGADYNTEEFYLSCVKGIDTGKTEIPEIIQDTYKERHSKALVLTEKTGMDLGEFDYSETSGWMVSVDNSFISEGAGSYVLDAEIEDGSVHVVRWQFTVADKGADLGYDATSFGGATAYYALQDKGALYTAYAENVEVLEQDSDTLAAVLKVMNTLNVSKEEIKEAVDCISGDEEIPADGKAAVTIQMNAISKTMTLKNAVGDLMDTGEPEGYIYKLRLEPGTYTLTGYAADGVTENGSIDLVVSEEEEQSYTFYTVTQIYCANKDWVRDADYIMSLSVTGADNTKRQAVFGQTSADVSYASALCYAGDTVSATVTPIGLRTAEYMPKTVSYTITANRTFGYNITAPFARGVTITVPTGAEIRVGTLSNYFIYEDIEAEGEPETEDDMDTWHYRFAEGLTYYYRVSMPGGVTYWNWVSVKEDTDYEVTKEDLYIGDSSFSPDTVIDDLSVNKYDVADLYINGNEMGYISLKNGETKKLECFRNWQAIEGISNAKTAEPDFHYAVIDVNGNASTDVIEVTPGKNSAQAEITAVGKGTAIVLVTYDAMTSTVGMGGKLFSAIWPENTGVLVVTVDEDGTAIHTGMTIQEGKNETALKLSGDKLDAELDVLYYQEGGDGAEYTFYPEEGVSVAVMHPEYVNGALTYKGFAEGDVEKNEDGSYTVKGLVQGSNLVRITKNGVSTYQVIRAKEVKIAYECKDAEGNSIPEEELKAGCSIEITYGERNESGTAYHGLYIPANKLAGIYNMSGAVCLEDTKGNLYTGTGNQYLFASAAAAQTVTVQIPKYYTGDTFCLNGCIRESGFGSAYGMHRDLSHVTGKTAQFTAVSCTGYMGGLPEMKFTLAKTDYIPVALSVVDADTQKLLTGYDIVLQDAAGNLIEVENGVFYGFDGEDYSYEIYMSGYNYKTGTISIPEGCEEADYAIELEPSGKGAWDGRTLLCPAQDEEGIYQIVTGSELAWFANEVNTNKKTSIQAVLTEDIDLAGYMWTPIGTVSYSYAGIFDGNGHNIRNLYVKDMQYAGLFGVAKGVIRNVHVYGQIQTNKGSAGGVVGYLQMGTTGQPAEISKCSSHVDITYTGTASANNFGGIAGYVNASQIILSKIDGCINYGDIMAPLGKYVGGIVGYEMAQNISVTGCTNYGAVTGSEAVGGILGYYSASKEPAGIIQNCYNAGPITGELQTGGLVGRAGSGTTDATILSISYSYNAGEVTSGAPIITEDENAILTDCFYSNGGKDERATYIPMEELEIVYALTEETVEKTRDADMVNQAVQLYEMLLQGSLSEEDMKLANRIMALKERMDNQVTVQIGIYDYAAVRAQLEHASENGVILETSVEAVSAEEAFKKALNQKEISFESDLSSINGLGAMEDSPLSGWYFAYGKDDYENEGLDKVTMEEGAVLELHYGITGKDIASYDTGLPVFKKLVIGEEELFFTAEAVLKENRSAEFVYKVNGEVLEGSGTEKAPFIVTVPVGVDTKVDAVKTEWETEADMHYVTVDGLSDVMDFTEPQVCMIQTVGGRTSYFKLVLTLVDKEKKLTSENTKVQIDDQTYTGKAIEPEVVVWFKEQILNSNDYTVTYENNIEVGTAVCTIRGTGAYTGTVTATFEIRKAAQFITGVQESYKKAYGSGSFTLNAEAKTPLTYKSLNTKVVKVGEKTGKVTIVGCGKAVIQITAEEGSYEKAVKSVTVKVVPKQQKIKALKKASKGAFHIRLKKDAKASGYQIVYSTSKNFKKAKKINISGYKKIKRTVKGLKSGRRYYVKARAYVKQGNEKYYGAYSRVKRIVIK